jgi:acetyl/propionyl-CoA carboxylase alpha subunit
VTFGLAAAITGIFSAGGDFLKGRQRADELRCSIAQQFVLDEIPSPALSAEQRTRLNALAVRLMERCMGETM